MNSFKMLRGIVAPIQDININTDAIIPKQFLKTIHRSGLGKSLFYEKRYVKDYIEDKNFILNKNPWRKAEILVVGDNFGCGSSREHAPWALLDFGIRSIISTSFADIFYNNCLKNGLLPVELSKTKVKEIMEHAIKEKELTIDLQEQTINLENKTFEFSIDKFAKKCLINGLDDIALTLEKEKKISNYENLQRKSMPWVKIEKV